MQHRRLLCHRSRPSSQPPAGLFPLHPPSLTLRVLFPPFPFFFPFLFFFLFFFFLASQAVPFSVKAMRDCCELPGAPCILGVLQPLTNITCGERGRNSPAPHQILLGQKSATLGLQSTANHLFSTHGQPQLIPSPCS